MKKKGRKKGVSADMRAIILVRSTAEQKGILISNARREGFTSLSGYILTTMLKTIKKGEMV